MLSHSQNDQADQKKIFPSQKQDEHLGKIIFINMHLHQIKYYCFLNQ